MVRSRGLGLALLLCVGVGGPARADNFEEYGFGARAQAMGGAFTALASDGTAAYYNPGGLILSRHLNLNLGFSFADYGLDFSSQNGGAADDRANRIDDLSAFTLGLSSTIPFDVPDRLAFGLAVFLPTRTIAEVQAEAPSSQPEWFRYGERNDRLRVIPAVAVKITDWLSAGLGASIFVDAVGGTTIVPNTGFNLKLEPDVGFVFGILAAPADWISFGITYRSEQSFKIDFPVEVAGSSVLDLEAITFFTPHQVQLGTAVNITDQVLVTFDLAWSHWSAYEDPFLVVGATGSAVVRQSEDFRDVFSPKLGVEWVATPFLVVRGGYAFRNSPVSDQDGVTNLVDTDKHTFTAGLGLALGQLPGLTSQQAEQDDDDAQTLGDAFDSVDLDLFFQVHLHPNRSQSKPPGDPVGDWDASGVIFNGGLQITVRF